MRCCGWKGVAASVLVLALIQGCSIKQNVEPVGQVPEKEVCIIENPDVKRGFLEAYQQALRGRSCEPRVLPVGSGLASCPTVSTYEARWSWDLAVYMVYARIEVYQDAVSVGEATYDATAGGGRMDKFINAGEKVNELVSQLYPICR